MFVRQVIELKVRFLNEFRSKAPFISEKIICKLLQLQKIAIILELLNLFVVDNSINFGSLLIIFFNYF